MALTKEQWYERLKGWVPSWVFESEVNNKAVFMAAAELLAAVEVESENLRAQTYLLDASGSYLDLHGSERSVTRYAGESDDSYRQRIRYIENTTSRQTLFELVKAVMSNGDPIIVENWQSGFADAGFYADCADNVAVSKRKNYNRFTVIVPPQTGDDSYIKGAIVQVLDDNKALGVFYDVEYKIVTTIIGEGGDTLTMEDGSEIGGE